jgi:glycosidase
MLPNVPKIKFWQFFLENQSYLTDLLSHGADIFRIDARHHGRSNDTFRDRIGWLDQT